MRAIRAILLGLASLVMGAAASPSPVGIWRTFDDRTGKESGRVAITEQAGTLTGRITGILDPHDAVQICTLCTGARHDQPVLGMTVLTGMHRDGNEWDGGQILDPRTGSIYHCTLRLEDGGARLVVRGYVGISLFGRSQTWWRAG